MGWRLQKTEIATPAGIKQEHPLHPKAPAHRRWSPRAIKGLGYIVTDKGPQQQWLYEIRKTRALVCERRLGTAKCGASAAVFLGMGWDREMERADVGG